MPVSGAFTFDDWDLTLGGRFADLFFRGEYHGPDHPQILAGQVGFWGEASDAPFVKKIHHKGFHYIVIVMP